MKSVVREQAYLENWRWLSRRIRCALEPNEPRIIEHYLAEGRYLARFTSTCDWTVALTSLRLLLDTAGDPMLPWHWRCHCLDQAYRPLRELRRAASTAEHIQRWHAMGHRLAVTSLLPSITADELLQGSCDE